MVIPLLKKTSLVVFRYQRAVHTMLFTCNVFVSSSSRYGSLQPFIMSLRIHLDRFCFSRTSETITTMTSPGPRSRSPTRNDDGSLTGSSPFFAPPGWRPPAPRRIRPVLFQINIEPLRRYTTIYDGFGILRDETTSHLLSPDMNALYTVHKVIYYDYAWRFKIGDLYELIENTFKDRWNLHLSRHWFRFLVDTQRPRPMSPAAITSSPFEALTDQNEYVATFLYRVFPGWQSHQHRAGNRIRHPDDEHTAYVVELQCEPCAPYWEQR